MDYKKQAVVTQPVQELRREGLELLIHTNTSENVIEKIRHLAPVLKFVRSPEYHRSAGDPVKLLFLTDDESTARQAALAFMSLRHQQRKRLEEVAEGEQDSRWDRLFDPFIEAVEQEEQEPPCTDPYKKITWETDFLVVTPGELCNACKTVQEPQKSVMIAMQWTAQNQELQKIMSLAQNLYVNCFRDRPGDELVDSVADLENDLIIIAAPDSEAMRYYVKRFSFEEGFHIIKLQKPEKAYYAELLKIYIKKCGVAADEAMDFSDLVQRLMIYRSSLFQEKDIFRLVDAAIAHSKNKRLRTEDFRLYGEEERSGLEQLNGLIGLENVKKSVKESMAVQMMQARASSKHMMLHKNMAFAGPPGTGKSMVAGIYGKILAELGVSNGKFVSAGRRDMIGMYLGHTAEKVAELFERSRGGVLFIDEAGSLTANDEYTRECITELVRYMEEQPETTVIFATYPSEMDLLLKSDPGFSSRIRKVIQFESYSNGELYRIFRRMAHDQDLSLSDDTEKAVYTYIEECRLIQGDYFGNAREVRRLLEAAIEIYSLRLLEGSIDSAEITGADIDKAGQELLPVKITKKRIGFRNWTG